MKNGESMKTALYRDCETDLERAEFFACGRAYETGIVAREIAIDVARAFYSMAYAGELTYPPNMRATHSAASQPTPALYPGCNANDAGYHRPDVDGLCSDCDQRIADNGDAAL